MSVADDDSVNDGIEALQRYLGEREQMPPDEVKLEVEWDEPADDDPLTIDDLPVVVEAPADLVAADQATDDGSVAEWLTMNHGGYLVKSWKVVHI